MREQFDTEDEGKRVVTKDGEHVGTIEQVAEGEAHVKPDEGLESSIRQKLGMSGAEEGDEMFALTDDRVESIDDEVRLNERS